MSAYQTPDIALKDSPGVMTDSLQPLASTSRRPSYQSVDSSKQLYPFQNDVNPARREEQEEEDIFDPFSIDPNYRLRTVRTAHSAIAESIRSEHDAEVRKRKRRLFSGFKSRRSTMSTVKESMRRKNSVGPADDSEHDNSRTTSVAGSVHHGSQAPPEKEEKVEKEKKKPEGQRRTLYINLALPNSFLTPKGDPIARFVRNKVRTSKYTIVTFIPKNLFEQFRRAANIYFLALVIIQLFPIFGAPNAQIGMLPLLAILGMTAIKDAVEDWRRARLDNEVNNSAATKLGGWRNVNQPQDPRSFVERVLGLNAPDKPSKGVKKLRNNEAKAGHQIVMERQKEIDDEEQLDDAAMVDGIPVPRVSISSDHSEDGIHHQVLSKIPSIHQSLHSSKSMGVMDWSEQTSGTAHWERTLWKKLEVGDLVLLRDNEQIPADIVVLSTSNADGLAFVETKNLDGETNLKVRKALKGTSSMNSEEDLEHAHFLVDSEPPHANLYSYNGVMKYWPRNDGKGEETQEAITINELLLRGCTVRNTKWIIGLVVFTGGDTKIMLNGGDTPSKRSKIEKETNFNVIMNFVILIILCSVTAVLHGYYRSLDGTSANSYEAGSWASDNIYLDSAIIFASCLIVFQNIVPISLYITIEIVKTIQAFFIFQDVEMYYEAYDTPCVPKTWNISDDLGQIEYVFSDKTGTLTQNIMEFKKCSVQGVSFGEGVTEAMMGAAKRDGRDLGMDMEDQNTELRVLKDKMITEMNRGFRNRYLREEQLTLIAPELARHLANPDDPLRPHLVEFFRALAICHTVLSDVAEPTKPYVVDYKAESPDEAALVAAARDVGFPFVNRTNNRIDIEVLGRTERWVPLRVLEFNSTRKRMSVLARNPQGRVVLFCKGADSVIYQRLTADHNEEIKASTLKDLETFANGGLRTLCIAQRFLSDEEYENWAKIYDKATAAVADREMEIEKACEMVEHSLTIVGATALEDKLQEGVPESIEMLHRAGIKLWILTGDKLQTAIEIGYSCNLLTNDMEVMIISADSEQGARAQIEAGLNKMASIMGPPVVNKRKSISNTDYRPATTFAVVIDGDSLAYALQPGLKALFLSLGTQCAAVICCRVSPAQKAQTVKLVKDGCNAMTLSIGDGANDVAMIQEANVGVGLFGLEGSQAAMSADYAFGQFRFLTRLLLVHGRWSYVRIADMHANFFYKNIIWTISMFWFLIFNSFDATYLFEYTFLLLYNLVFTSLPVGILGAFDQDTNAQASMAFPQLYKRGIAGLDYTRRRFWIYMGDGLYQSCIIFFIPYLAYAGGTPWSSDGLDTNSLWDFGTTVAAAGVFAANLYVGINTRYWTFISWLVIVGSILLCYIWIPIYSALAGPPYEGTVNAIYPSFSFWATVIITVFLAVGPRWLISAVRQSYSPRDKDIIREAWVAGDLKEQLGIRHRKAKKNKNALSPENPPSLVHQVINSLSEDSRGQYERANISSPQKSPNFSGQSTPRSPFSYPPVSPGIERALDQLTPGGQYGLQRVPSPLTIPSAEGSRPGYTMGHKHGHLTTTPADMEYHSPSALDQFNMTGNEQNRSAYQTQDLRRASLHANASTATVPGPMRRANSDQDRPGSGMDWMQSRGSAYGPLGDNGGMNTARQGTWTGEMGEMTRTTGGTDTNIDERGQDQRREAGTGKRASYVDFSSPRRNDW